MTARMRVLCAAFVLVFAPAHGSAATFRVHAKGEFVTLTSIDTTECIFAYVLALRQAVRNSNASTSDSLFIAYDVWDTCTPAEDGTSATLLARGWGQVPDAGKTVLQVTKQWASLDFSIPSTNFESQGLTGSVSLRFVRTGSPRTFVGQSKWTSEYDSIKFVGNGTSTEVTAAVMGTFMGMPLDGSAGAIGLNQQRNLSITMR